MIPVIDSVLEIAKKFIPDKDKQLELDKAVLEQKTELEKQYVGYAKMDHDLRMKEIEYTGFKASWRPYVMFTFSTMVAIHFLLYYIVPAILVYFPSFDYVTLIEPPKIDPAIMDLVMYSIIGIGGFRTVDKWRRK